MTFDLHEGHHPHSLLSGILLTKFGSHRGSFKVFDPRDPYPCKNFVAITPYMLLTKFSQNPITYVEGVANCQKETVESNKLGDKWRQQFFIQNWF